jgi:hypothetical protein
MSVSAKCIAAVLLLIGAATTASAQSYWYNGDYGLKQRGYYGTPYGGGHHYRIVIPLTRRYGYRPYWWPQGQYHWSPYGLERWGYWCEPTGPGSHRLSC